MNVVHKGDFNKGLLLMGSFWLVFVILMSPVFPGKDGRVNCLDFMDNLYNAISKDSAYYIPRVREQIPAYRGTLVSSTIAAQGQQAQRLHKLLASNGIEVSAGPEGLHVRYEMAALVAAMLVDADSMFANKGHELQAKYGEDPRQSLYDWYTLSKALVKNLEQAGDLKSTRILHQTQSRALEPAYNYYGIEATPIRTQLLTVILSLVGYVIYTLWFGFAILYMFEGWGLKLDH